MKNNFYCVTIPVCYFQHVRAMTQNFFEYEGRSYLRVSLVIQAYKGPLNIDKTILEKKAKIGVEVHDLCQRYLYGEKGLEATNQRAQNYFDCFKRFCKNGLLSEPTLCEHRMFDKELGITGQLDLVCPVVGKKEFILIDLKTTASTDRAAWGLQGTLYCKMLMDEKPELPLADTFSFIQLKEKGNAKVETFPGWKEKLGIAKKLVNNFMKRNKKTLEGMYEHERSIRETSKEND